MLGKGWRARLSELLAGNHNAPLGCAPCAERVAISKLRALATGAALVTAIDTTPVAVVSIYKYARHHGSGTHRRAC